VPEPERTPVRLTSGTPGAGFHTLAEALAREYGRVLPHLDIQVYPSDGAASNLEAIQRGDADIGLSHADVTYLAFAGRLAVGREVFGRLRGIAMLQLAQVHVVVRAGSGIQSVADLRGRRISLGRPSWGSASTAALVLHAFGLGLDDAMVQPLRYDEAAGRLSNGALDALLVTGTSPLAAVTAASAAGARILPLDGRAIDALRRDYPFFTLTTIPGGSYPRQPDAIHTIGVHTLLVCREDLDETLVHDLTERLFEVLPSLPPLQASLGQIDLEQAPATPIPLHEGAARYYRERELAR
jgi:TRAP transporter TAXI family solute receptor